MKYKIYYSSDTYNDLDDIWDYICIELKNPSAAKRVINKIIATIKSLEESPYRGSILPTQKPSNIKYIQSGNYVIFYKIKDRNVYIGRILYRKRDLVKAILG